MWYFHTSASATIAVGTPTQQYSIEPTNDLSGELRYHKLEVDLLAKKQAAAEIAAWEAHNLNLLARLRLREVDFWGAYEKEECHRGIEIRHHIPPSVATRGHASLNVSFGMAPHQLHSSHEMAPIAPIAPLFQNFSHKDRGSETTPENIWLSDLNDTKEHDSKKPAPVPDASHAMPLDAIEVGGTVENSAIRKKRNCPSDSHPSFSPYALPPSNKLRKRDCPDDTPQRPLSACKYEGNNILFDLYIGSFLTEFELFFMQTTFSFAKHVR